MLIDVIHPVEFEVSSTWNFEIAEGSRERGAGVFRRKILLYIIKEDFDRLMREVEEFKGEKGKTHNDVRVDNLRVEPVGAIYIKGEEKSVTNLKG